MTGRHAATGPTGDDELLAAVLAGLDQSPESIELRSVDAGARGDLRGYTVLARDADGTSHTHHLYVEPSDSGEPKPGVVRVASDEGTSLDVWSFPQDPALPALPAAAHPDGARVLLERLGIAVPSAPDAHAVSYRPHRRAAVRVRTPGVMIFLKVVPPGSARAIVDRHARWANAGIRVPAVLGWSDEGLAALDTLPGSSALDALESLGDPHAFAAAVDRLRARIATVDEPAPARRSLAARSDWYRDRLTARYPLLAGELAELTARVQHELGATRFAETAIHGDLHLGQIFVPPQPGELAVLDLDTGGRGDPADDDAGLWAHLVATAYRSTAAGEASRRDAAVALAEVLHPRRSGDPDRVRRALAIAAVHLLGHAMSAALPPDEAIRIGAALMDAPDENPLIAVSASSHAGAGS